MSRKTKAWLLGELRSIMEDNIRHPMIYDLAIEDAVDLLLEYISDKEITEAYESIRKWDI